MLGKSPSQITPQTDLFRPLLSSFIDFDNSLVRLAAKLDWKSLESSFESFYSKTGTPSKPVRLMAGLLMLKQMFNYSDETLVEVWKQNPYYQYFTGELYFKWELPCDPSDLVHFRNRIGQQGVETILAMSVSLFATQVARASIVNVDTTVQEKNITFPTDTKLAVKIINKCRAIAADASLGLRQSYTRTVKENLIKCRFAHHPKRQKEGRKAIKKIKGIAGRLVRELERNLEGEYKVTYATHIELFKKMLAQKRSDTDKIYSLHEPEVACIAKGKAHKQYEFGSKIGFATLPGSNLIVGVAHFKGNPHDSKTLEDTLISARKTTQKELKAAVVDRGYKGMTKVGETNIIIPNPKKDSKLSPGDKTLKRKLCRGRAAIEPLISHLKHDHRMMKNFLKGVKGDIINAIMAAAAFNLKKYLKTMLFLWQKFIQIFIQSNKFTYLLNLNLSC